MANVLTSQTILDGERLAILKFTGFLDTTETAVVKVDVSTLNPQGALACTGCKLNKIWSQTHGCEVQLLWAATTPLMIVTLPQNDNYFMDYSSFGGIPNNSGTGKTGDISFTTQDVSAGDTYSIVLEVIKTYG
tara:strand:+ start:140 stop:538 length:399 start_codon:yes stop_codon:yes gene_type:complete